MKHRRLIAYSNPHFTTRPNTISVSTLRTATRCTRSWTAVWHITWGIAYEFLRVVTHPRVFPSPWTVGEAWAFILAQRCVEHEPRLRRQQEVFCRKACQHRIRLNDSMVRNDKIVFLEGLV